MTNGSCCSDKDCHPTKAWTDDDGTWWVLEGNIEMRVPEKSILRNTVAPDGNSHVCVSPSMGIMCFIRGQPKS